MVLEETVDCCLDDIAATADYDFVNMKFEATAVDCQVSVVLSPGDGSKNGVVCGLSHCWYLS